MRAGAIGDTLMATPLIRAARRTFPNAYIAAVCSRVAFAALQFNPHLDEVLSLAQRHMPVWLSGEKRRIVRNLRTRNLDCILSLETNSDFTKLACAIRARRIITYDAHEQRGCELEHATHAPRQHAIEAHLSVGARFGIKPDGFAMEMHYPPEADATARARLAQHGIGDDDLLAGVHAGWGGRRQHPTDTRLRSWHAARFAEVIRWLTNEAGARVVLTGTSDDRALNDFIAREARVPMLNMAGELSFFEFAALVRRMNLYLTVDSGPAHLAAALATPLLTLWGPGIFEETAPVAGAGTVRILRSPPDCAPCYGTPLRRTCRDNICMKRIEVADVIATAKEMLSSPRPN